MDSANAASRALDVSRADRRDFHRNLRGESQPIDALFGRDDGDPPACGTRHDLLAEQRPAPPFDHREAGVDLVRPVQANVECLNVVELRKGMRRAWANSAVATLVGTPTIFRPSEAIRSPSARTTSAAVHPDPETDGHAVLHQGGGGLRREKLAGIGTGRAQASGRFRCEAWRVGRNESGRPDSNW